jgi:hypothetical protein
MNLVHITFIKNDSHALIIPMKRKDLILGHGNGPLQEIGPLFVIAKLVQQGGNDLLKNII